MKSASAFANQDRPIMEICHSILQLDAIAQFLIEYIDTQLIDQNISKAQVLVKTVLDDDIRAAIDLSNKFSFA